MRILQKIVTNVARQKFRTDAMKKFLIAAVRLISKFLYKVLPPDICTKIACRKVGRFLTSWTVPAGESVYCCDYNIRLSMQKEDAIIFGVGVMGCINPHETKILFDYLKAGDIVVDIGVYKEGWLALIASKIVGDGGKVICFEAIEEFCSAFKKNIFLNSAQNITLKNIAISNRKGAVEFELSNANSSFLVSPRQTCGRVVVDTISLDEYLIENNETRVDFLIIDAEGAENLIIDGGKNIITQSVKYILLEVEPLYLARLGLSPEYIVNKLSSFGFMPFSITRKGLKEYHAGAGSSETANMFFAKTGFFGHEA